MKEKIKQYLRLGVLIIIVAVIIFAEPISSGRFAATSDKLEESLSIVLREIKYPLSEDLTLAEFEKNGWIIDSDNDTEGKYINLDSKLIQPDEELTLQYINYKPDMVHTTSLNRAYFSIKNSTTKALPYNQCECIAIALDDYWLDINVTFPKGITLGDSYGRVEMAYGNGQKLTPYKDYLKRPINPLYEESVLAYTFDSSDFRFVFTFYRGRLVSADFIKLTDDELASFYP